VYVLREHIGFVRNRLGLRRRAADMPPQFDSVSGTQ
jgi:hypothetical protein